MSTHIARLLHPDATITGDLQEVSLPHKRFDAAVGNVPFSAARVHDSAIGGCGPLHEYFVARAVAAVRPGGYVVVVTSRHELDAVHGRRPRRQPAHHLDVIHTSHHSCQAGEAECF